MRNSVRKFLLSSLVMGTTVLSASSLSGLWFAMVEVDSVNEVHSASVDVETAKPVKYPFNLQYVFHMDASGNTKLLKEVYIMQTKDANSSRVLVTDETRLSEFEGIIRKGDNKLVPVRLSSPSIDFDSLESEITLSGQIGSTLVGKNIMHGKLHPTNPFRHQFHPNHKTGRDVERSFSISIEAAEAQSGTGKIAANVGKTKLYGRYEETLVGLHKVSLKVGGQIILTQVSSVEILNPAIGGE